MSRKSIALVILASTTIFALNAIQPFSLLDDILFLGIWRINEADPFIPIRTFADVMQSQAILYPYLTGRIVFQTIAQTFFGIFGKCAFNVCTGVIFGLTLWLATRFVTGGKPRTFIMLTVLFFLWILMPTFADIYVWAEGAVNYLWVCLAILLFIMFLERVKHKRLNAMHCFAGIPALLVGWSHEGMALPLALSLVGYFVAKHKSYAYSAALPYVFWFSVGAFACAFAPSTIFRATQGSEPIAAKIMSRLFLGCVSLTFMRITWILAITIIYAYRKRRDVLVASIKQYPYLYSSVTLCIGIIFASGVTQARVTFGAEFFAMLIEIPLLASLGIEKHKKALAGIMAAVMAAVMIPGTVCAYKAYRNNVFMEEQIQDGRSDIIKVRPLSCNKYLQNKFVFPTVDFGHYVIYNATDSTDENVRCAATLLDRKRLVFLPEDMVDKIEADSSSYIEAGEDCMGRLMAMQISKGTEVKGVTFILNDDKSPLYKKPFAYKGHKYQARRWQVIDIAGLSFVFFDKPVPNISRRIKKIVINS